MSRSRRKIKDMPRHFGRDAGGMAARRAWLHLVHDRGKCSTLVNVGKYMKTLAFILDKPTERFSLTLDTLGEQGPKDR